jgi:predicted kinase
MNSSLRNTQIFYVFSNPLETCEQRNNSRRKKFKKLLQAHASKMQTLYFFIMRFSAKSPSSLTEDRTSLCVCTFFNGKDAHPSQNYIALR